MAPQLELSTWEPPSAGGIRVAPASGGPAVFLWAYEWNMFGAFQPGLHTHTGDQQFRAATDGERAAVGTVGATLAATAAEGGVDLSLSVANLTGRDWPPLAAVVPCLSPGKEDDEPVTGCFVDEGHAHTYYYGESGLERLDEREIHYQRSVRERIRERRPDGGYPWDDKWPEADRPATEPLLVRGAEGEDWSVGIAWEDSISAQGHNPWNCMHLSVRVGPLPAGHTTSVGGRLYLLPGGPERILERYEAEFLHD
ncbi:MAG: hypothetical protein ABEH77_03300 [Halobacteriaceae archaeon]